MLSRILLSSESDFYSSDVRPRYASEQAPWEHRQDQEKLTRASSPRTHPPSHSRTASRAHRLGTPRTRRLKAKGKGSREGSRHRAAQARRVLDQTAESNQTVG